MIKQTRGALNFLIASYKAILKHAVLATALSSVAMVFTANAKTYDLSDDNGYYSFSLGGKKQIIDDANDTDVTINKIANPNFNDYRDLDLLQNNNSYMSFVNGGKLNVSKIYLFGGNFDASGTEINAPMITIADKYHNSSAKFGDLTVSRGLDARDASIQANNVYLDKSAIASIYSLTAEKLQIDNFSTKNSDLQYTGTINIENLNVKNSFFSSSFDAAPTVVTVNKMNGNYFMNSMAIGSNTFVMLRAGTTSDYSLESIFSTIRRVGDLSNVPSRGYKAILYLNDNVCLKGGYGLTVDGNTSSPTIEENTIRIGENSAIALSKTATEQSLQNGRNLAAISFSGRGGSYQDDGTIKFTSTSRIILDSNVIKAGSIFRIFSDYSTYINESDSTKNYIIVQSINGNFKTTVNRMGNLLGKGWTDYSYGDGSDLDTPGSNNPGTTPPSNPDSGNQGITPPSNPDSGNTNPGTGDNGNAGNAGANTPSTPDNGNAGNAGTTTPSTPDNGNKPGNSGNTTKPSLPGVPGTGTIYETFTRGDYTNLGNTLYGLLHNTINDANAKGTGSEFLSAVAGETFTGGKEAEQVARLGQLGGVYQSAFTVSSITDDIVSSRNGVGSSTGSLIVSDNNNGFGIWLSPMVKVASSDGFDSDGLSYGTRVRLTDFAIGADYTLNNGSRVGAYFHTGNGKSTGKGLASHTDGDLKYYGAGLYGKYSYNNFSLLADVSYNKITDDVDTDLGLQSYSRASASVDTYIVKAGLTGQYNFNVNTVSVIPHVGVRYTTLKSDDYSVQAKGLYIANVKSDRTKVVSFPVGVTVEKAFNVGQTDWKVKPAVDLGVNFNTGDTDASYKTTFIGANEASLNAEIADSVVYTAGAGLKFSHQKNADIEAGVVYAASENTNDVTFHVNGSYQF